MMPITDTVKQLIIINIIFFIGSQFVLDAQIYLPMYYFENPLFGIWQPLTSMFMHGNLMHILFNMFGLYMFGSTLEQFWGAKKFLFFYISCGLGAALLHQGVDYFAYNSAYKTLSEAGFSPADIQTLVTTGSVEVAVESTAAIQEAVSAIVTSYHTKVVGASGALYGILVAFAYMFPEVKLMLLFLPVPIKAKYFVPVLLLIDLVSGLFGSSIFGSSSGIAHFAHIGGAITGFFMMWFWKRNQYNSNRWN